MFDSIFYLEIMEFNIMRCFEIIVIKLKWYNFFGLEIRLKILNDEFYGYFVDCLGNLLIM